MGVSSKLIKGVAIASAALISINISAIADGHGDRPEAEVARDAGRKPQQVMEYLGVKSGMTIFEPSASSGYYTALLSKAVGPNGKVYAQNSERFWDRLKENAVPRYEKLGNVEAHIGRVTDFGDADGRVDMIPITLIYHHLHYTADSGDATPENSKALYAKAMQMLKPGGVIAIIEHQAPDGTPRAESAAWHRASLQNAIDDLTAAGFEYVGNSNVLANPNDPQNIHFRDLSSGRDTSQRFVAKFRKPK
jgi:predicted methyltransferase